MTKRKKNEKKNSECEEEIEDIPPKKKQKRKVAIKQKVKKAAKKKNVSEFSLDDDEEDNLTIAMTKWSTRNYAELQLLIKEFNRVMDNKSPIYLAVTVTDLENAQWDSTSISVSDLKIAATTHKIIKMPTLFPDDDLRQKEFDLLFANFIIQKFTVSPKHSSHVKKEIASNLTQQTENNAFPLSDSIPSSFASDVAMNSWSRVNKDTMADQCSVRMTMIVSLWEKNESESNHPQYNQKYVNEKLNWSQNAFKFYKSSLLLSVFFPSKFQNALKQACVKERFSENRGQINTAMTTLLKKQWSHKFRDKSTQNFYLQCKQAYVAFFQSFCEKHNLES